jgi:hypothetical protein
VAAKHPEITRSHVQKFLSQDYTTQLTQSKQKEEAKGHIVATSPNEIWQFDILDLSRYARKNNGVKYILACVDVFTRKAYVEPMKQKSADNVKEAFEAILGRAGTKPQSLLSDQDGAFLGGTFGQLLNEKAIILNTNALRDHHVMGIIDNFAFRIKNILTKGFLNDKNVEWLGKIQEIVDNYNKDGTAGLGGIAPNDAHKEDLPPEEKAPTIMNIYWPNDNTGFDSTFSIYEDGKCGSTPIDYNDSSKENGIGCGITQPNKAGYNGNYTPGLHQSKPYPDNTDYGLITLYKNEIYISNVFKNAFSPAFF